MQRHWEENRHVHQLFVYASSFADCRSLVAQASYSETAMATVDSSSIGPGVASLAANSFSRSTS